MTQIIVNIPDWAFVVAFVLMSASLILDILKHRLQRKIEKIKVSP